MKNIGTAQHGRGIRGATLSPNIRTSFSLVIIHKKQDFPYSFFKLLESNLHSNITVCR